ncbi:Conserved_hypothetical protein [Hexamita inflata]|uniref:Uncharacterized protein n=1 Tax=Hexamita inflata TaxID=28002 RepID=A0AA86UT95_9EUKA|nr:Conserved hypothetical protein [Hexamita inflata]
MSHSDYEITLPLQDMVTVIINVFIPQILEDNQICYKQQQQFRVDVNKTVFCDYRLLHKVIVENCQSKFLQQEFFRICHIDQIANVNQIQQDITFITSDYDLQSIVNLQPVKLAAIRYSKDLRKLNTFISPIELEYLRQAIKYKEQNEQGDDKPGQKYAKIYVKTQYIKQFCEFAQAQLEQRQKEQ